MMTDNNYIHHGEHRVIHKIVRSRCYMSETNITMYTDYILIKNTTNKNENVVYTKWNLFLPCKRKSCHL